MTFALLRTKLSLVDNFEDLARFFSTLKGLAHAKIIKKSVILFRALNMTI